MIVCTSCGTRNEDGESFCGECGSYLEWEGERLEQPAPEPVPEPVPAAPADQGGPGFVARVKTAVGLGDEQPPATTATTSPASPTSSTTAPAATAPVPTAPAAATAPAVTAPAVTTPHAAAPLVVPLTPAAPADHAPPVGSDTAPARGRHTPTAVAPGVAAQQPAAVRPGAAAPKPRRHDLPPEERAPAPGETICGSCGAGNAPTRKFCRRCGTDLADAPVAGALPWWRRIFARSGRAAPAAGTRPQYKPKRSYRWLAWLLGVIVVAAAAVFFTKPYWSGAANKVIDRVKGTTIVNPTSFHATSSASGHGAGAIRDGAPNVYWAPANSAKASGQSVSLGFASPYRLVYLRVFNGASDQLKDYLAESSAQRIEVTVTRKGHGRVVKDFTLSDKPGAQDLQLAVDDVTGVQVTILSTYRPAPKKLVALGELEFLARK